jgi:Fe-S-cluster containining protein
MNTFFEAAPLIAEAGTRQRLSLREACRTCENVCCRTGSPMVSSQERDWIVRSSGCNDYFTAIPGASDFFWIGVNRDGTARQMNDKGAATVDPCPYFDEISGDCLIQEWKPLDCAVYPARLRKVGDTFDVVFTTKCPATAEGLSEEFKVIAQTEAPHILGDNRDASKLAEYRRVGGSWTIKDEE